MTPDEAATLAVGAAVVASVATAISAIIAILLWLEARAARNVRLEASVSVYPTLHGETGMYLTVVGENYGPAAATEVLIFMRLRTADGDAIPDSERRMLEPEWGPGRRRRFMPRRRDQIEALNTLADEDLMLELEWAWSDGRRVFWRFGRGSYVRSKRTATHSLRQFRDDMYGGQSLIDADPLTSLPKMHKDLRDIKSAIDRLSKP